MKVPSGVFLGSCGGQARGHLQGRLAGSGVWRRRLGLPPGEIDPVRIVQAAQIRLRRWRRSSRDSAATSQHRLRQIIEARDGLLRESMMAARSGRRYPAG
ncbi:MAG: hypothetical protein DWI03_11610 [Planctomycetota bacterium]|nr:MAG: hypothetical protein DWI03_11610 [Planctomycetota bacterium]